MSGLEDAQVHSNIPYIRTRQTLHLHIELVLLARLALHPLQSSGSSLQQLQASLVNQEQSLRTRTIGPYQRPLIQSLLITSVTLCRVYGNSHPLPVHFAQTLLLYNSLPLLIRQGLLVSQQLGRVT